MARPLRRKRLLDVTEDPDTGQERILESSVEIDSLSDFGSIDTVGKRKQYFTDCGCHKPVGGRCVQCNGLSCVDCHGRCYVCSSPICLKCSIFVDSSAGGRIRFCRRCHDRLARRSLLRKIGRFFLAPLIDFDGDKHGQA